MDEFSQSDKWSVRQHAKDDTQRLGALTNTEFSSSTELSAFNRLELMGKIRPGEFYLPTKAKDGDYSLRLKEELAKHDSGSSPGDVGKVRSVQELKKSRKQTVWIVDEIGAEGGCVVVAAEPGTGKTSLLYRLANSVSVGETFMGELPTRKRKVLVVQGDESERNAVDKLDVMGIDAEFDFIFPDERGWKGLEIERLSNEITFGGYQVVLLDSITTLLGNGTHGTRMNDAEFAAPLYELNRLASQLNLLIVITSHLRKPEVGGYKEITIHDVLGTGTLTGAVSDVWALQRPQNPDFSDHYVLRCLGKRNCDIGTAWNLQGSQEDFSWILKSVVDQSQLLPARRREYQEQILELLSNHNGWLHADEIASQIRCDKEHARRVCRRLCSELKVSRTKGESTGGRPSWLYGKRTFPI